MLIYVTVMALVLVLEKCILYVALSTKALITTA